MPKFFRSNPSFSAEALAPAFKVARPVGAASGVLPAAAAQVIEIGQAPVQPVFVRGGKTITAPVFNPKAVEDYIIHTIPIFHTRVPVAVSQSIPAGVQVAKGTPVDIVFAAATDIPYSVFDKFHPDLASRTVADLLPLVTKAEIAPLLDKDEATLTAADKTALTSALNGVNVGVNESDPTRNLSAALKSLRDTRAFA